MTFFLYPDEHNEDGDYGILVMATDGLWDVSENEAVARTVFQTLHKYPTEKHRYTMVAQELVAKARGKINDYGHWRLADSKAAATVDDISVIVIPVYQYYKEQLEYEQKCLQVHRERLEQQTAAAQAFEAKEEEGVIKQQDEEINGLVNGLQEMAHVVIEPDAEEKVDKSMENQIETNVKDETAIDKECKEENTRVNLVEDKIEEDELDKTLEKLESVGDSSDKEKKEGKLEYIHILEIFRICQ